MWQAEVAYQKATEINDKAAQGWQGLSELYHDTQQWVKAAETDQTLVGTLLGCGRRMVSTGNWVGAIIPLATASSLMII